MTMITPSYLGETIEYSSLHACRSTLEDPTWGGASPRAGFAFELDPKTVLRGGFGLYYDSIYMKSVLQNNGTQNIAVFGPGLNPAGSSQVAQSSGNSVVVAPNTPLFPTLSAALAQQAGSLVKISTFDKNFRPGYVESFDFNVQHSFPPSLVWQLGYVGTKGTHLLGMQDINPGALGSLDSAVPYNSITCPPAYSGATPPTLANPLGVPGNNLQCSRPYFKQFPNFSVIDEARSNLGSIYNSMQTSLRSLNYHGLTSQLAYTWGHALDYETGLLPYVAQNPLDESAERGNSDFDVRNTLTGYANYIVPKFAGPERLTKGWEINSGFSFHGGTPYTVTSSSNPSNNGESADRAVQVVTDPNHYNHSIVNGTVQWFAPGSFVDAPTNTYSPTRRGQNYNPGYSAVDVAFMKNTPIVERVSTQFRVDVFNIFNRTNIAPLGFPSTGEGGTIGSTLGPYLGNPGIGPGEPLNAQFALKILF